MSRQTATNPKPADVFKTFPEFSRLTIEDRAIYDEVTKDYPPASGLSFYNLMTWWNSLNSCSVSTLNGNLVLSYWLPGDEKHSGLSVIGTNNLDKTIATVLDWQREQGQKPKLLHVPEFVIARLRYPELYECNNDRYADEYIYKVTKFSSLDGWVGFKRARINKFLARQGAKKLEVRALDLADGENILLLNRRERELRGKSIFNFAKHVNECMQIGLDNAKTLGTKSLCLFIDGSLEGFILYSSNNDTRYMTFSHAVINMHIPYIYDYIVYRFSQWFEEQGVEYINLDSDLGIPALRMIKLGLGPDHFFRYYTLEPAK